MIPALDEAANVGAVVAAVPRQIPHVADVRVIVVDDGSTDGTALVAQAAGADHVVRHRRSRGLVGAFRSGIDAALALGADIVVHLDGDGQHDPAYIARIVAPVILGEADVVVECARWQRRPRSHPSGAAETKRGRGSSGDS